MKKILPKLNEQNITKQDAILIFGTFKADLWNSLTDDIRFYKDGVSKTTVLDRMNRTLLLAILEIQEALVSSGEIPYVTYNSMDEAIKRLFDSQKEEQSK